VLAILGEKAKDSLVPTALFHFTCITFQIRQMNSEINQLIEKRMMNTDPTDDKLSLFRQQAAIITRKKEGGAETLQEIREELVKCELEYEEKRSVLKESDGGEVLKGDEVNNNN
jgi:intraflagellar transport protein 81